MSRDTINDDDRAQWIANDEGLYNWHRSTRLPLRQFIRENREELDRCIRSVTEGRKPAHYLAYGARPAWSGSDTTNIYGGRDE